MKTIEPIPTLALDDLLHMAASAIEDLLEHTDPNTSYYSGAWADVPGKLRAAAMLQSGNSPVHSGLRPEQNIGSPAQSPIDHGNSPVIPDCWIPVSERMPETDGNYWGWWSESKRQGPVWFIKSELQAQFQSHEITHWMPLPAAPQEVPDGK